MRASVGVHNLSGSLYRTIVIVIASSTLGATALNAQPLDVRALAAGCATCHRPTTSVPAPLAGNSREMLATKLRGYRNGSLHGTVMPQIAKGYTIEELDALAGYFAQARAR